jgi:hypothetical protein
LAIRLGRPRFWLGYRRFCCHACTSWHFAMGFISSFASALPFLGLLKFKSCFPEFRADAKQLCGEASACRQKRAICRGNLCFRTRSTTTFAYPRLRTVGVPFLPGASHHSRLFHRQSLVARIPPGMTAIPSMRLQGQTSDQNVKPFARSTCYSTLRLF